MKDSRVNGFLIVAFAAWLCGAVIAAVFGIKFLGFSSPAEIFASVLFVFTLCLLFFGRLSAFSMLFSGLISGQVILQSIPLGILSLFCFLLAGFAGTLAGFKLFDDFHGIDNFYSKEHLKQLGLYLTIALILAVIPALFQQGIPAIGVKEIQGLLLMG